MNIVKLYWYIPILILILGAGIILTIRLNGIQFRKLFTALKLMCRSSKTTNGQTSSFGALCISLSATIGTGNIIGIAVATKLGGPGALFWMIVFSIFGLATKYTEGFLAIKYRTFNNNTLTGGPFAYIEYGMGKKYKFLSIFYAIFGLLSATLGIGTMTQSNGITDAFNNVFLHQSPIGNKIKASVIIGIIIVIICGLVIFGGTKRVSKICECVIPFAACIYILTCLFIVINHLNLLKDVISLIFKTAFSFQSFTIGSSSFLFINAIIQGAQKGIFVNEAGLGSSAIALSCADEKDPNKQGLISMGAMFITMVISIITGLVVIMMNSYLKGLNGINITNDAFTNGLFINKTISSMILFICVLFFAITTIIGWSLYGVKCLNYLTSGNKKLEKIYLIIYIIMVFIGAVIKVEIIWNISDICNALMAIPNLIALIYLSKVVKQDLTT